jgi:endonuclease YncB( thermonuclease family)
MKRLLLFVVLGTSALVRAQSQPVGLLFGPVPVDHVIDGDTVVVLSNVGPRDSIDRLIDTPENNYPEIGREPSGGIGVRDGSVAFCTRVWVL